MQNIVKCLLLASFVLGCPAGAVLLVAENPPEGIPVSPEAEKAGLALQMSLRDVFGSVLSADKNWMLLERKRLASLFAAGVEGRTLPSLGLGGSFVPGFDLAGSLSATDPVASLSLPLSVSLDFEVPLFDPQQDLVKKIAEMDAGLAIARGGAYRTAAWMEFLLLLMDAGHARDLLALRSEQSRDCLALVNLAKKRADLGAGSKKEVLRATLSNSLARGAALSAEQTLARITRSWPVEVMNRIDAQGGLDRFLDPLLFAGLAASYGLDFSGVLQHGTVLESLKVPPVLDARFPEVLALERERVELEHSLSLTPRELQVGLNGSIGAKADFGALADGQAPDWDLTAVVGLDFTVPILSGTLDPERVTMLDGEFRDRLAALDDGVLQWRRDMEAARVELQAALDLYMVWQECLTNALAYEAALRTELAAGGSTVESLLQGLQDAYSAREYRMTAFWNLLASGFKYLGAAGILVAPGGESP